MDTHDIAVRMITSFFCYRRWKAEKLGQVLSEGIMERMSVEHHYIPTNANVSGSHEVHDIFIRVLQRRNSEVEWPENRHPGLPVSRASSTSLMI